MNKHGRHTMLEFTFISYSFKNKPDTTIKTLLWTGLCPLPDSHGEALTPNVTLFGDRAFDEVK